MPHITGSILQADGRRIVRQSAVSRITGETDCLQSAECSAIKEYMNNTEDNR